MSLPLSGGVNSWPCFMLIDTGSAYAIKKLDETTAATTLAHAMLTLNKMESAKLDYQADGSQKMTVGNQQYTEDFQKVVRHCAKPVIGTTTLKEYTWVDGIKEGGTASGNGKSMLVLGGGPIDPDNDSKRALYPLVLSLDPTSGSWTMKPGEGFGTTFIGTSQKLVHDLVIPKEMIDTAYWAEPDANITIPGGDFAEEIWLATT
jgi:hypothetical protein